MNNTSPDAVFKAFSPGIKYSQKAKKGKAFENALFVSSTYDPKDIKDINIEYGENKSSISNFLSKELITKLEESSPYRSIKSSKFITEQIHQGDDKHEMVIRRKNSDSSFETSTSNLLSFQIKDLEQRTKINKMSSLSNLQINECDEIEYDLRKEINPPIHVFPSPDIVKQGRTLIKPDFNLSSNEKSMDLKQSQVSGNNIINFNPIINNNIQFNTINLPNIPSMTHNFSNQIPQSNQENPNFPSSMNHNTILENYFYHLRQLQGFQQIYLNQYCSSSTQIPGNNSLFNNTTTKKQSFNHSTQQNQTLKSSNEKKNSDSTEEDSLKTESTKTFMYGKNGWICHSCNNFNYESRSKCNRCLKVPKFNIMNNSEPEYAKADKSKVKLIERDGDWICVECKNLNFSFRVKCNRCQAGRAF